MVEVGWSAFFLVFLLLCHWLIYHQRRFLYSKPPGRRLVLADVHSIQTHSLANVVTSLGLGGLLASLLGPLSFTTSFLLIEWFKISLVHFFGISNVSVVLQILIILDFEWISKMSDQVVIRLTHLVGVGHLVLNVCEYLQMYRGSVPMLTKGPAVTFYGREELLQEVSDGPPGKSLLIFLLSSLLFQVLLLIFKRIYSHKITNYALLLRATLVNNVLNIYGFLITIIITIISCCWVVLHYLVITHGAGEGGAGLMPPPLLLLYLLTGFFVSLPYIQNFHLRQYARRKLADIFPVKEGDRPRVKQIQHHPTAGSSNFTRFPQGQPAMDMPRVEI